MSYEKMFFISGLPRSGSTLLSAILSENPEIHTEGISSVCQFMWDIEYSYKYSYKDQILANNKQKNIEKIIKEIPKKYYSNVTKKFVIDKNRSWTLDINFNMICEYIEKNPKIVVLTRDVKEIVLSFLNLNKKNNIFFTEEQLLTKDSEPLMRSINGLLEAKNNNKENFLFLDYKNFIENTEKCLSDIYDFYEINFFHHNLKNIVMRNPENDSIYGIENFHKIRNKISKSNYNIYMSNNSKEKCNILNSLIYS